MKKKIHVYYHVCLMNDGIIIAIEQMHLMAISGLIKNASSINIGIKYDKDLSDNLDHFLKIVDTYNINKNINILYKEENSPKGDGEISTIVHFRDFSKSLPNKKNAYILYFHTKGVSRYDTKMEVPVRYWRNFMEYHMIHNWKKCCNILDKGYESCGSSICNMDLMDQCNHKDKHLNTKKNDNTNRYYYPGTFYWMNTSLIKRIPDKYFTTENEYGLHCAESLPGILEHKHYYFSDIDLAKINPYETLIHI